MLDLPNYGTNNIFGGLNSNHIFLNLFNFFSGFQKLLVKEIALTVEKRNN